jgi:hypothetical protein
VQGRLSCLTMELGMRGGGEVLSLRGSPLAV